jgi:hypothetical protein
VEESEEHVRGKEEKEEGGGGGGETHIQRTHCRRSLRIEAATGVV